MPDIVPYIVGICGGSASGKTWFIQHLWEKIGAEYITIVSQDNYYKPITEQEKDENGEINFDLPQGLNLDTLHKDIERLKRGEAVSLFTYEFNNPAKEKQELTLQPRKIILVEGIFLFHHPGLFSQFDLTIFIEAPAETKLQRRLRRDSEERGIPGPMAEYQWLYHVMPAYEQYILPYRDRADMVVYNHDGPNEHIEELVNRFKKLLDND